MAGEILERPDRRIGADIPVEVGGARRLGADDPHRRTLGIGAQRPHHPDRDPDVGAAREHRLLGLAAALGIEQLQLEAVLTKYPAALPNLGDRGRPVAVLPDRELEPVLRTGAARGGARRGEARM